MENVFPSRKEIVDNIKSVSNDYKDSIINEIKYVDVEKVDFSKDDFKPRSAIVESQKTYIWIRVFVKEETDAKPEDTIRIEYKPSGEFLDVKFICYAKKGHEKDSKGEMVNYNNEDNKKELCLMVDLDKINNDSDEIPFIRSLFRIGKYYEFQLMKRDELTFTNMSSGETLDYFDTEF